MTVHYQHLVATERVGGFFRLLFRWRGSIYQHIYGEIGVWLILYYIISCCYRFAMGEHSKREFEQFCIYGRGFADYIPVTFVVGFYVVRVIVRRWTQWENIPWPERLAFDVSTYVQGDDMNSRMVRRTLMRYCNLGAILCFRDICVPAKRRFPHMDHLLVAGLLTPKELEAYTKTASRFDVNWWIPFQWAYTLLWRSHQEGRVGEGSMMRLHDGVNEMRTRCWIIFMHDWIPIPMVYTQVCTLSVYLYMLVCLFARQYITPQDGSPHDKLDLIVPIFTIFQLVFYLGWMKVAEVLINPFGMDADDFDINYIIDRNLRISYTIVDYARNYSPPLEKDMHWDSAEPELPHTDESKEAATEPFIGSTANMPEPSPESSGDSGSNGEEHGVGDEVRLIKRKTSRASSVESSRKNSDRMSSMAARVRSLLGRQHTVTSTTTLDESKTDALKDLLSAEEGDRVADWYCSPDQSPITVPVAKWGKVREGLNATLQRIEETPSHESTVTGSTNKRLQQLPPDHFHSSQLERERNRNREQQEYLLDFLQHSSESAPEAVEGSRFMTTPVVQDENGVPVGSALLPPAANQHGEPAASTPKEPPFDGGGRFDMNTLM